jgi:hypothetical protein
MSPISLCREISEEKFLLFSRLNSCHGTSYFTGNEGRTTSRTFVIEENSVTCVDIVGFTVIDGDPVCKLLSNGIGRSGVKRGLFGLRFTVNSTIKFGSGGLEVRGISKVGAYLVEANFVLETSRNDGIEDSESTNCIYVSSVFGHIETDFYVANLD